MEGVESVFELALMLVFLGLLVAAFRASARSPRRRLIRSLIAVGATVWAIVMVCPLTSPVVGVLAPLVQLRYRARWIDHVALRESCLPIMKTAAPARSRDDVVDLSPGMAEFERLPSRIRFLHPKSVTVTPERTWISFGGGFWHFGLIVFADESDSHRELANQGLSWEKMAPGVWYYSDQK
jgi:hypothetical protein